MSISKYGVDTRAAAGEKTAQDKKACPICGQPIDPESNVPRCPNHGTRPFEHEEEE